MISSTLLNVLLNTIIHTYFQNSTCILILTGIDYNYTFKSIIPAVNIRIKDNEFEEKLIFRSYGCQAILIVHQNSSIVFQQLEHQMKAHNDRFNSKRYLIVADSMDIFHLPELEFIVNFLVILPVISIEEECILLNDLCWEHGIFELVTHTYTGAMNNSLPVTLDLWSTQNKSFIYGNNLYPNKLLNQQGRKLKCATINYKPYSVIEKDSPSYAIGTENGVAHEYAAKHNMSVQYILDDKEWGIIHDNWTGVGILGHLVMDKADIGYGSLGSWVREYSFLDLSKPVVTTEVTCLVPEPKLATGWLTPLLPFTEEMWLYFCISFGFISISVITITAVISKRNLDIKINYPMIIDQCLLRITKILVGQSIPTTNANVDIAFKYLFSLFLYSLVVSASYSSGLATVMTIPRYLGIINTVSDLASSNLYWGATGEAWIYSLLLEERQQYIELLQKFVADSEENLKKFANVNNFGFLIERLPSGQFAIGDYITEDTVKNMRLMKEDLYWEHCVFMLRKNSPLLISLDSLILRLNEAGLAKYWEKKTIQYHMNFGVQNIVAYYRVSQTKEPPPLVVKLEWVHVEGVFVILIGGFVVSITCFLIELLYFKKISLK
ncbi:hypothetical protein FQR65_LT00672 [Abscondita terminalis]|nr:hypothetical protein FQR65_LT00672 [Abscondita terminalis]